MATFLNYILHIDRELVSLVAQYGAFVYALLFFIFFCETGLVVTPFLPGDSLLFAAGALSATSHHVLDVHALFLLLVVASIAGNTLNFAIGKMVGPKVFRSQHSFFFNKKYLTKAHDFYDRYGGKTIIIARFMPIIRTFAPFVAGIAAMDLAKFTFYNVIGALLWIGGFLYVSFWFGNIPLVKDHFSLIVVVIIGLSLVPPIVEIIRQKFS